VVSVVLPAGIIIGTGGFWQLSFISKTAPKVKSKSIFFIKIIAS
jgi:hypothetical protein